MTELLKALLGNGSVNTRRNEYATIKCPVPGNVAVTRLYNNSENTRMCFYVALSEGL
jgi:hypothetical protein